MNAKRATTSGDRAAILASIEDFRVAYDAGDIETIAGYYSDELVKLRQGAPPETKSAVVERLAASFREYRGRLEVVNDEIGISGDLAFVRGSFTVTLVHSTRGETQTAQRRFLEIWRRESGGWRVGRTMDNRGEE